MIQEDKKLIEIRDNTARDLILKLDKILRLIELEDKFKQLDKLTRDLETYVEYRLKEKTVMKDKFLNRIILQIKNAKFTKKSINNLEKIYYKLYDKYPRVIANSRPSEIYGEDYIKLRRREVISRKYNKSIKEGEKAFIKISKKFR